MNAICQAQATLPIMKVSIGVYNLDICSFDFDIKLYYDQYDAHACNETIESY